MSPQQSWSLLAGRGRLAWSAVAALFLIVISGSVVVNAGAQAACKSWPACFSSPAALGLVTIQMVHRSVVLVGSVLVVAYLVTLLRAKGTGAPEHSLSLWALGLLAAQIVVGAASALHSSHTEFADVHLGFASALWGVVVAIFALTARTRRVASEPSSGGRLPSGPDASHVLA
jgi:heme A synthase